MKHWKKLIALFLAMVMATGFATTAMAAETENNIPENVTRHTIELTVAPDETIESNNEDGNSSTFIWGNGTYNPPVNGVTYTPTMNIPERYFAYETTATTTSGGTCSGYYIVSLVRSVTATITSVQHNVDGVTYKNDWIEIYNTSVSDYQFKIHNGTSEAITVTITYYSWA